MSAFTGVDLVRLPAPTIIKQLSFETIFEARKARLIELSEASGFSASQVAGLRSALTLESEPLVQLLQEDSYRELLLRAEIQDAGKNSLLGFAQGATLEHIAAFYGVSRQIVQAADKTVNPPIVQILESDDRLRRRTQLAPEGFTTAGSEGSYVFWSLSASPLVKDVSIASPSPKNVVITVLGTDGDGVPDQSVLDLVNSETQLRRPLTDLVIVEAATIISYDIAAVLTLYFGPDAEVVRAASEAALQAYVDDSHRLGYDITVAGLHAALWRSGVQNVDLGDFAADLVVGDGQAAHCANLSVTIGGRDV